MQWATLTNKMVHDSFKTVVRTERKITAEVLDHIREIYQRRIYLEMGYASLLEYLIEEAGYSKTAALRRMDGAKLLIEFPELKEKFAAGTLNLSQASLFAQGLRQKMAEQKKATQPLLKRNELSSSAKEEPDQPSIFDQVASEVTPEIVVQHNICNGESALQDVVEASSENSAKEMISTEQKRQILEQLQNQTYEATQKALAAALDLPVQQNEKRRFQKDQSVRAEITFTPAELQDLERAKELLSHVHPGGKLSDVIAYMTKFFLERKDPRRKVRGEKKLSQKPASARDDVAKVRSDSDLKTQRRSQLSAAVVQIVHHRNTCCQWRDPETGRQCRSRFQLQIDHKQSKWAGGGHGAENLQLLCAAHNRLKYKKESQIKMGSAVRSAWELIGDYT